MASTEEDRAIAEAITKLTPAEAEMFLHKLERAVAKRRLQLWGYMIALVVWAVAMFFSLAYYGAADPDTFRSWIFAMPFLGIGLTLYGFGWLADRAGKAPPKKPFRAVEPGAPPASPASPSSAPGSSEPRLGKLKKPRK